MDPGGLVLIALLPLPTLRGLVLSFRGSIVGRDRGRTKRRTWSDCVGTTIKFIPRPAMDPGLPNPRRGP